MTRQSQDRPLAKDIVPVRGNFRVHKLDENQNRREGSVDPGNQHIRHLLLVLLPLPAVLLSAIVLLGWTGVGQKV